MDCDADTVPVPMELIRDIGVFEYDEGTQTNISLANLNNELIYSIYPNPASNYLKFDLENLDNKPVTITVLSINGKTLLQKEYHTNNDKLSKQLDISMLNKGMYIIYFQNGIMSKFDKFIKL